MLLHIQLHASVCTIHTAAPSRMNSTCARRTLGFRVIQYQPGCAGALRDSLSKVGFPFGVV